MLTEYKLSSADFLRKGPAHVSNPSLCSLLCSSLFLPFPANHSPPSHFLPTASPRISPLLLVNLLPLARASPSIADTFRLPSFIELWMIIFTMSLETILDLKSILIGRAIGRRKRRNCLTGPRMRRLCLMMNVALENQMGG
ncbi:hypothetical protein AAHA92_12413 [Salvia divinorum]|uniref:Uncharacterized protein n=1 Tax=Salvia divinorum TaxID=28513 RepID=A0ABD1HK61_SALDI